MIVKRCDDDFVSIHNEIKPNQMQSEIFKKKNRFECESDSMKIDSEREYAKEREKSLCSKQIKSFR